MFDNIDSEDEDKGKNLEPNELFDYVKSICKDKDISELDGDLKVVQDKIEKAKMLDQKKLYNKLIADSKNILRERVLVKQGMTKAVLASDVNKFLDLLNQESEDKVSLIELERYPRIIPDEPAADIQAAKELGLFDHIIILYTDLVPEESEPTKKEQEYIDRNKDPIAFGVFFDDKTEQTYDRMYFITDWEDEYCDLTFHKFLEIMKKENKNYEHIDISDCEESIKQSIELWETENRKKDLPKEKTLIQRIFKWLK